MSAFTIQPNREIYRRENPPVGPLTGNTPAFKWLKDECGGPYLHPIFLAGDRIMWTLHPKAITGTEEENELAMRVMRAASNLTPKERRTVVGTVVITGRNGSMTAPLTDQQRRRTSKELLTP